VSKPSPPVATSGKGKQSITQTRYSSPKSNKDVQNAQKSAIPKKTKLNTPWAENKWRDCSVYQVKNILQEIDSGYELCAGFATVSVPDMNHWLGKFVLEMRTKSGKEYCPDSLY